MFQVFPNQPAGTSIDHIFRHKHRRQIVRAEGCKLPQYPVKPGCYFMEGQLSIHLNGLDLLPVGDRFGDNLLESLGKSPHIFNFHGKPSGKHMPTIRFKQVTARADGLIQVEILY